MGSRRAVCAPQTEGHDFRQESRLCPSDRRPRLSSGSLFCSCPSGLVELLVLGWYQLHCFHTHKAAHGSVNSPFIQLSHMIRSEHAICFLLGLMYQVWRQTQQCSRQLRASVGGEGRPGSSVLFPQRWDALPCRSRKA